MNERLSNKNSLKDNSQIIRAIWFCFFVSGAAGLIYQILWVRMLGLVFGHTVYAITTVLVVFMGGLALGSYLFGLVVDRIRNLLWVYGVLEIGIGFYCLFIPPLMGWVEKIYLALTGTVDASVTGFSLLQFLIISPVLLIPTTLMGGTLPVLSRFFVRDLSSVGKKIGRLYAFNTFGAVLGTFLAGFCLLPVLGMNRTLLFAATLNIGMGILVFLFDRHYKHLMTFNPNFQSESSLIIQKANVSRIAWDRIQWLVVLCLLFSGAASMVYEIAWTRALSLIIGSSTYAYSAMLLSFLVGIGAGSAIYSRFARKGAVKPALFVGLQLAIGLFAAVVFPLLNYLPEVFLYAFRFTESYSLILLLQVIISMAVMILPTLFIGATFPCAAQIVSKDLSNIGRNIGRVYAFNTLGAIVGSFGAGFILIPLVGVELTIKFAILVNLIGGLLLFFFSQKKGAMKFAPVPAMAVAVLLVVFLPALNPKVMSSGVSIYGPYFVSKNNGDSVSAGTDNWDLLFYKDGISSTVSVHKDKEGGMVFLRVNGKTDASNGKDMHTQLMLGHLPTLLHQDPKSVLVIGLGSGVTVGALAQHPFDKIDVVEIEPAVAEASDYFKKENRLVLSDPRVRLFNADARNFLLRSKERYDLIISEPSNPWIGGVASLFTVEFFDLLNAHLKPGGLVGQWLQGYSLSPNDVRMVVGSFQKIFPETGLWVTGFSDYLMLGGKSPILVDLPRFRDTFSDSQFFREDLAKFNVHSGDMLLGNFLADNEDLTRFAKGVTLNTDDLLPLEFSAPRSLYLKTDVNNMISFRKAKQSRFPVFSGGFPEEIGKPIFLYQVARGYLNNDLIVEGVHFLDDAIRITPDFLEARMERGKTLMKSESKKWQAVEDFEAVIRKDPGHAEAHFYLGQMYLNLKSPQISLGFLEEAVKLRPENPEYRLKLAKIYRQLKRYDEAVGQYREALDREKDNHRIMGALGATLNQLDRPRDAISVLDQALKIDPGDYLLYYHLGEAYLFMEEGKKAREFFERAIKIEPRHALSYSGLGKVWRSLGEQGKAADFFEEANRLDPRLGVPKA